MSASSHSTFFAPRFRVVVFLIFIAAAVPAYAQPSPEQQRFAEVLKVLDTGPKDEQIDEGELNQFLYEKAPTALNDFKTIGLQVKITIESSEDFSEFVEGEASRIFILANRNGDKYITVDEFHELETTPLSSPLKGTLKDLLPTSLPIAGSPVNPPSVTNESNITLRETIVRRFHIRQSFLDESLIARPASITWNHYGRDDKTREKGHERTSFNFRGALSFDLSQRRDDLSSLPISLLPGVAARDMFLLWTSVLVYEADVSTDSKDDRDRLTHRFGFQGTLFSDKQDRQIAEWISAHNFSLTFDYTTDSDYRIDILGGTVQYSPNMFSLGIGRKIWLYEGSDFDPYVLWRPYLGLVFADIEDPGNDETLKKMSSFTNTFIRVGMEFGFTKRILFTPELSWY